MKIVIVEDELFVAEDLAANLKEISPDIEILSILCSIKKTSFFTIYNLGMS